MASKIFDRILLRGIRAGELPGRSEASRNWYRSRARNISQGQLTPDQVVQETKDRQQKSPGYGDMYMFRYDPKHKNTLPFYDTFPLVFPIGPADGGFLGLNMHYLPPMLRAQLMDALYTTVSNDRLDDSTTLRISYDILKSASKFNAFKPTVKHYLTRHVKSRFIYISPTEWDIELFLPTARFVGGSKNEVYAASRRQLRG